MTAHPSVARTHWCCLTLAAAAMAALTSLASGSSAHAGEPASAHTHPPSERSARAATVDAAASQDLPTLEEKWGVTLLGLRTTAAGYMLDLRFRVLDPAKAAPLLERQIARHVIVEKSGAVLRVPSTEKLGSLRSAVRTPDMVKANRIYSALFANPGRHAKAGDTVTLVLGDLRAERLAIE